MKCLHCISLIMLLLACNPTADDNFTTLNIQDPAEQLQLFGPSLISTDLYERDLAIHEEGNLIIYTLGDCKQQVRGLVQIRKGPDGWSDPELLNISGMDQDIEPFFDPSHPDRLYFASNRPIHGDTTRQDYNIWYSDATDGVWSTPVALDSVINTRGQEYYPSLTSSGNLYFTATRPEGPGREDIYRSIWKDEQFSVPEPLDSNINTPYYEFNAYINPEEDLLLFSSFARPDGLGGGDLYYSKKSTNDQWSPAQNLGKPINSPFLDYCPFIDWNNNTLYFTSERTSNSKRKIQSAQDIIQLAHQIENGFGNIYKVSMNRTSIMK